MTTKTEKNFKSVNPKQSFPKLEEEMLQFWNEEKIFEKSVDSRSAENEFNFYDGPPFATGTPHYGHILAGTIKDVIPRYQTMKGKKVSRKFGWDCHGLPIENIVEKKLKINGKDDIENKIGVHEFNETCRANVFGYVDEWKKTVNRMGRWVDMENDYKTMDTNFMESVWWVFKSIYDKGLIYEGNRIVPYCPRCTTPLSNFEVNQGYKDKQSKAVTIKFKVKDSPNKYILAWTTTPWTLYANLGLAVGENITYSEILDKKTGETYILASERIKFYYKSEEEYTFVREYPGTCLVGMVYEPLFDDFYLQLAEMNSDLGNGIVLGQNSFSVVIGHHVTTESGTGIVHIAPAYGEDDNIIGKEKGLGFVAHIDDSGKTYNLLEHNGEFVFDFNEKVVTILKEKKLALHIGTIDHSYPHCWRCGTPLIYRAISAWYVAVEKIRDKMVANNLKTNWTPEAIKEGRFGKWLEQARDWNISRNRYWGSAIPVWQNEDKTEEVCIGSVEELYEANKDFGQIEKRDNKYFYTATGKEVDLHKHFVDEIFVKSTKTGEKLKRIPEVLDCWFESGAMPYASKHYPFALKNSHLPQGRGAGGEGFPADFIAEGLDQTRGWFYTLIILSTALFDSPATLNTIVNGIVLAEDGKKMSKSLQNYPAPEIIFDKYGADAMRFYLMNSPVVEAQDLRFSEIGVEEVVKKVILPLWNTYSFFTTYANIDNFEVPKGQVFFARHAESESNALWTAESAGISGAEDNPKLTEKGISQAKRSGEKAKLAGITFDLIVASPLVRALQTAEIIAKEVHYTGEILISDGIKEQNYAEFEGKSHKEIAEKYGVDLKDKVALRKIFKNSSTENYIQFQTRVEKTFEEIIATNKDKNILFVGHAGSARPFFKKYLDLDVDFAHLELATCKNAQIIAFPKHSLRNPLDKWILGELHMLIKEVGNGLDAYKINDATKHIPVFMDNLTNWYIRRSRKRFWKSENDSDKLEAYNTLYTVLVEISKVIAPFMPFVSESIYKNLTGKTSVHLDIFPEYVSGFVNKSLSEQMAKTQQFINLGLAWRVNHKLKVRQPLKSITIGEKLEEYYKNILKEELNVKEVIEVDGNMLAKKICKPNARLIGPKFSGDVKLILQEAKAGNFEELEEGRVKVGKFILEMGEFELAFEAGDSQYEIEAGFGMVIAMDPNLTPELIEEGIARDLVRSIQEARKEANYNVDDRIKISLSCENEKGILAIKNFGTYIETETLSTIEANLEGFDIQKEIEFDEMKIVLSLKR